MKLHVCIHFVRNCDIKTTTCEERLLGLNDNHDNGIHLITNDN